MTDELTDAHYDWAQKFCSVPELRNQSVDPNAGQPNQSVDPNAGQPNQSVDPNAGQPNQSVDPNAGAREQSVQPDPSQPADPDPGQAGQPASPVAIPASMGSSGGSGNPYKGTPLAAAWQEGYDDAFKQPDATHQPPSPLTPDGQTAYAEGVLAGTDAAPASNNPQSVNPPDPADGGAGGAGGGNPQSAAGTGVDPSGAQPEEAPQSMQVGGLPAFRYNLPTAPIATATIATPEATIELTLSVRGSVTVTFPNAPRGVSTDIDTGGWRLAATQALGPLTAGMRVNGIGTETPSIGVTLGSDYTTTECRLVSPNTMLFIGQARIDYTVPSKLGKVAVQGQAGFEMKVTVFPHPAAPQTAPDEVGDESWFHRHRVALAAVAVVALVVVAIAAAPETGGASLTLLTAA